MRLIEDPTHENKFKYNSATKNCWNIGRRIERIRNEEKTEFKKLFYAKERVIMNYKIAKEELLKEGYAILNDDEEYLLGFKYFDATQEVNFKKYVNDLSEKFDEVTVLKDEMEIVMSMIK